jgi:peroxiredoxin
MKSLLLAMSLIFTPGVVDAGPVKERTAAPDFAVKTIDRHTVRLSQLKGKIVLLDFGAVNCPPCRMEMPILERWHQKYGRQGVVLLGLIEMNPSVRDVRKMVKERGVTYPVAVDKGELIGKRYGLIAHPTTVLIDREGRVVKTETGYVRGDEKEIEASLHALLASPVTRALK